MNPTPRARAYPVGQTQGSFDVDLIRRVARGDEDALGALYDRWCGVVSAFVARILREPVDADEIVEEVFWQVWRQASQYDPARSSVQTWLATIARTRALDRVRAVQRRREEPLDVTDDVGSVTSVAVLPSDSDPQADAERSDQRRIVLAALATLPTEQRTAMELAYYRGLSQSEIATRTGEPLGTVKTRMRLAMRKLRESLAALREERP